MPISWIPERFFYSHASKDHEIAQIISEAFSRLDNRYEIYFAERELVGRPLIQKLKEELLNSNALLCAWTENTSKIETSQIISFELGMAFSLGLPIYILRFSKQGMPWFFDKVTDYTEVEEHSTDFIFNKLKTMEPFSFNHPVEVIIPNEPLYKYSNQKSQSANYAVATQEDRLNLYRDFNEIIHFKIINRRRKPEKDVRLIIKFPSNISISFNAGTLDGSSSIQRNEIFDMRQTERGLVRMYWPSLPLEAFNFEIRLNVEAIPNNEENHIELLTSSENIIGWRKKHIKISYSK